MREGEELTSAEASKAERFQALESHPDLERLLRHVPSAEDDRARDSNDSGSHGSDRGVRVVATVTIVSLGVLATALTFLFCAPLAVGPVVIAFAIAYAIARHFVEGRAFARQPLRRVAALVVDEGTSVGGSSDRERYTVTLEARDGTRVECTAQESVRGTATVGDLGVAYLKGSTLVEFARIDDGRG